MLNSLVHIRFVGNENKILIKTNYKNGKMHGLQKQWYSNGQLKIEYNYIDDKKHGLQKYWKENGEIGGELIYKNGEYITHVN
jgi:antitoxin component YwqK of YwqJK toxin-antitoxin module